MSGVTIKEKSVANSLSPEHFLSTFDQMLQKGRRFECAKRIWRVGPNNIVNIRGNTSVSNAINFSMKL